MEMLSFFGRFQIGLKCKLLLWPGSCYIMPKGAGGLRYFPGTLRCLLIKLHVCGRDPPPPTRSSAFVVGSFVKPGKWRKWERGGAGSGSML